MTPKQNLELLEQQLIDACKTVNQLKRMARNTSMLDYDKEDCWQTCCLNARALRRQLDELIAQLVDRGIRGGV